MKHFLAKIRIIKVFSRVAVNPYVLIFRGLDARGGRNTPNRHTDTHTRDTYSNLHCACTPKVNNYTKLYALYMYIEVYIVMVTSVCREKSISCW